MNSHHLVALDRLLSVMCAQIHDKAGINLAVSDSYVGTGGPDCGVAGTASIQLNSVQMPLAAGDMLVMFSDGVDDEANMSECQNVENRLPQKLAEEEVPRWGTATYHTSVLVYRHDSVDTGTL
jgi:hypothetical protein